MIDVADTFRIAVAGGLAGFEHVMLVTWTGLQPGEKTAAFVKLPRSIAPRRTVHN